MIWFSVWIQWFACSSVYIFFRITFKNISRIIYFLLCCFIKYTNWHFICYTEYFKITFDRFHVSKMNRIKFRKLKQLYIKITRKYPLVIDSVHTGILISFSDFISQTFIEDTKLNQLDKKRNSNFFLIGFGLVVRMHQLLKIFLFSWSNNFRVLRYISGINSWINI